MKSPLSTFLALATVALGLGAFASCANKPAERKPVPPQGSDTSSQPWNIPQQGEGAGALGGMLDRR